MAVPYLCAECLERTELKLFDGPFGFAEALSDLANAAFLYKTLAHHATLNLGKLVDKAKEMHVAFDEIQVL